MTRCVCSSALVVALLLIASEARKPDNPLQGTSSVCADVCTSAEAHVELDLSEARIYRQHEPVQITLHPTGSGRCREPALIEIPLSAIGQQGLIKLELDFGPVLHNFSIDLAIHDENNQTRRSINVFNQQVSIDYRSKTETKADLHGESVTLLEPGEHLTIFLSNEWIQIENKQRNQQKLTWHLNETNAFFSSADDQTSSLVYLRIGLNRDVYGQQTGIGLCSANLTFIECQTEQQAALDIDVNNKTFEQRDLENIHWISHLNYLDPNADVRECTAQGVVRLTFDPSGSRRIARLDFRMGAQIQGFTFNVGDSATNNGYGGDGGTTSNSAEIHSNDNRFYIWANTKICGDTLLLKIDYNVIEPFDNITILISNERIELTNHRSYHQVLQSPYLYALDRQNVTCNCFDSLCYPGVQPDNDVYVGINRVIGGTYRPGTGVCQAKINWIQCKKINVSQRIHYESVATTTEVTTTTTSTTPSTTLEVTTTLRTTTVESTTIISNTNPIDQTTEVIEHTNNRISSEMETSSIAPLTKESHLPNEDNSSSTFVPSTSTPIDLVETTLTPEDEQVASSTNSADNDMTTTEAKETNQTAASSTETSTTHQPRLIHLLTNSSHSVPHDNVNLTTSMVSEDISETSTAAMTSLNPCTLENLRANLVYHEYSLDKHKFIFCDSDGKMNVIACSPSYVWSQMEQSCILPN